MEQRLYGVPGSEHMHFDPASVYESDLEPWDSDELPEKAEIEEWTVHPPSYHLPSVDMILTYIDEWSYDYGELSTDYGLEDVIVNEEVKQAAEVLLTTITNRITYRMAEKKVASHWVTWNEEGEPLLDGEPMYIKIGT